MRPRSSPSRKGDSRRPASRSSRSRAPVPKLRPDQRGGPLHVEIVAVGRELLRGRVTDANAHHLAGYLSQRGALVHRITIVDDKERAVAGAVTEALGRGARLVITTGGLGPASDDRTLAGVADALHLPLALNPRAREMVEHSYRRLRERGAVAGTGLTAAREKMCTIPIGGEPLANDAGAAPGVILRIAGGGVVVCLPGVPEETRAVFEAALPALRDLLPRAHVACREVEAPTADESVLRPILDRLAEEFPFVWIKSNAPGFGRRGARVLVTLEASAPSRDEAETTVEHALQRLLALAAG